MIRKLFHRGSLTTKATLVVSSAMALGFFGLGVALTWNAFARAKDSQRLIAQTMADSLALSCELALAVGDRVELERLAQGAAQVSGVLRVEIRTDTGEVAAHADRPNTDRPSSRLIATLTPREGEIGRSEVRLLPAATDEASDLDLTVRRPSAPKRLGIVEVRLCSEPMVAEARKQASIMLVLAVISGTLIALLVNVSLRRWTKRLDPLVKAAGRIREGDLSTPINTKGEDEIAMLANALESMRDAIGGRDYELRTINDHLQERVEERTRDLLQAKTAAEAASEAKSLFLASMSHEIRTPMTAILGFADLMSQPQVESERTECVTTIRRNGEHLLAIINDILDISKIEAGKMGIERVECEPTQLLAEIESLLSVRARAKGLEFSFALATPIPGTIQTDPVRFRQILVNLVGNAIKYTEKGRVSVRISFEPSSSGEDGSLRVEVADTGIGMSPDQVGRLFQPFVQGDASMARRFGGTGLGLAIARRLAKLLGGDISLQSTLGHGSVFTVIIATGDVRQASRVHCLRVLKGEQRDAAARERAGSGLYGATVLLAEDGPDNQRLISYILRGAGVRVEIAPDGAVAKQRALDALNAGAPFDLILMDMQMPELDGYTATTMLRNAGYKGPIIALTAHAMVGDREKCIAAGCNDYTTKPIQRDVLLAKCREQIDAQRSTGSAAA